MAVRRQYNRNGQLVGETEYHVFGHARGHPGFLGKIFFWIVTLIILVWPVYLTAIGPARFVVLAIWLLMVAGAVALVVRYRVRVRTQQQSRSGGRRS